MNYAYNHKKHFFIGIVANTSYDRTIGEYLAHKENAKIYNYFVVIIDYLHIILYMQLEIRTFIITVDIKKGRMHSLMYSYKISTRIVFIRYVTGATERNFCEIVNST